MNQIALGATLTPLGCDFAVWSHNAARIDLCLFDATGTVEERRLAMHRGPDDVHRLSVEGVTAGNLYGLRAHGLYSPEHGLWFDPAKLLVDPYAKELDSPFVYHPRLSLFGNDTADLVPKAIVTQSQPQTPEAPLFHKGGLIYEVAVKPLTMLHPDIPQSQRGTVAALAHPSIIAHLKALGVSAVELMPITAWIDERHLPGLGLTNGWGYNPVAFMALDPRLVPGGMAELRQTVATLHDHGIGTILDLVFNHSGESDRYGATLSMRGLDNLAYYRHMPSDPANLINDTGCGNTLACDHPVVHALVLDSLKHFALEAGIDGFRFDLASILGRSMTGFDRNAPLLAAMTEDPVLKDRILIAEPWDIGPGGYQLGQFPDSFLEWNDRARDDIRMFWRGDGYATGRLATALAGSAPLFQHDNAIKTRSVNFLAAHDGFTLMDLVSHQTKHNEANGENNRDGHNDNHSWNNGVEGETKDPAIRAARKADVMALLSTLFVSRGTLLLTAGDEGGRSQRGNNNAYAQDNEITWMDWAALDADLIAHTTWLSNLRQRFSCLSDRSFFTGEKSDVEWWNSAGEPMTVADWDSADGAGLTMVMATQDFETGKPTRLAISFNRHHRALAFDLPVSGASQWLDLKNQADVDLNAMSARSVRFAIERVLPKKTE